MRAFFSRFKKKGGCWTWIGPKDPVGYGRHKNRLAHRVAYEIHYGAIPAGYVVHHFCHNKLCVRPDHLECMTASEHAQRHSLGKHVRKRKPQPVKRYRVVSLWCKHGHPRREYAFIDTEGTLRCRACSRKTQRIADKRYRAKLKLRKKT